MFPADKHERLLPSEVAEELSDDKGTLSQVKQERSSWLWKNRGLLVFHLTLLLIYLAATSLGIRELREHQDLQTNWSMGFSSYSQSPTKERETHLRPYCLGPAHQLVKHKAVKFNAVHHLTSPYVGENKPSIDQSWHKLLKSKYFPKITFSDI